MASQNKTYEPVNTTEEKPIPHIEAPMEQAPAVVVIEEPKKKYTFVVKKFMCCMELATGMKVYGALDILSGVMAAFVGFFILWARTHEHALDKALKPALMKMHNSTDYDVDEDIAKVNHHLNKAAIGVVPLIFLVSLMFIWIGNVAFKAADAKSLLHARQYYIWKLVNFVFSIFAGGFWHFIWCLHAVLVCRSFYLRLFHANDLPIAVVNVTPSAPAPQEDASTPENKKDPNVLSVDAAATNKAPLLVVTQS